MDNEQTRKAKDRIIVIGSLLVFGALVLFGVLNYFDNDPGDSQPRQIQNRQPQTDQDRLEAAQGDAIRKRVAEWVKANSREPGSVEFLEWSKVVESEGAYIVRVKYRAKNGFGGYSIETTIFKLDHNRNVVADQVIERF